MFLQSAFLYLMLSSIPRCSTRTIDPKTDSEKVPNIVDLSNLNITSLDKNLSGSREETFMDLSYNNISKVDSSAFVNIPNLVALNLTGNPISGHSLHLNLSNLETLVLDEALRTFGAPTFNETNLIIGHIPNVFPVAELFLPRLKNLYLRKNKIFDIHGLNEETMPNLTHLYLSGNDIEYLDFVDKLPKSLTHLYLDNNKISKFVYIRQRFETVGWCSVEIPFNETYDFKHLENLEHLDLSYNNIQEINEHPFQNSPKLISLRLDHNNLSSLPDLSGAKQIKKLDLSYNNITDIDVTAFKYLSSLEELKLFGNPLSLPAAKVENAVLNYLKSTKIKI